ncbi:hypothetical protein IWX58_002714 [Rubrivivax gelatinosus]|uniref:hypothetical protein n=2 Tax=Rubrivivax gelatinosus TaxID=28068 RepID=UPI0018CB0FFB|nr:hypothetical protein [Rubrivivax gelatinosus]MBG6081027.1 hypothetical protein [Rubrivivax gelatinosus]
MRRRQASARRVCGLLLAAVLAAVSAGGAAAQERRGGWQLNRFGDAAEARLRTAPARPAEVLLVGRDGDAEGARAHVVYPLNLVADHRYRVRVRLSGEPGGRIQLMVRRSAAPYDAVVQEDLELDEAGRSAELEWVAYDEPGAFDLRIVPRSPRVQLQVGTPEIEDLGPVSLGSAGTPPPFDARLLGVHLNKFAQYRTVPALGTGLVRIWDMRTNWHHLAPSPEAWTARSADAWKQLDDLVEVVQRRAPGATLLMTLGQPPAWASASPQATCAYGTGTCGAPASLEAWRDYVQTLAQRYKGRIRWWELWNEPDYARFYVPTLSLVELARVASQVLKSVDPENRLVSPGFTGNGYAALDRFLAQGGGRYVDAIGFHWYVRAAPESLVPRVRNLRALMQRRGAGQLPLWNTEGAPWCNPGRESPCAFEGLAGDELDALPMRYVLTMWLEGVAASAYYTVEGSGRRAVPLFDPDRKLVTRAGEAFASLGDWLRDARVESVQPWGEAGIAVRLRRGGDASVLVWSQRRDEALRVPADWGMARAQTPWGDTVAWRPGEPLVVGRVPLRLQAAGGRAAAQASR